MCSFDGNLAGRAMATTSSESDSSRKNADNKENESKDEQNNMFECNICLDNAKDAVVSVCGHLFWLVLLLDQNYKIQYSTVKVRFTTYIGKCVVSYAT